MGMTFHGAFMRRQAEVTEVFAHISTRELFTIKQIMTEMMFGPKADKTRKVIKRHVGKMLDSPIVRTAIQMTRVGMNMPNSKTPLLISQLKQRWCRFQMQV